MKPPWQRAENDVCQGEQRLYAPGKRQKTPLARVEYQETAPGSAPKMMFARVSGVHLPLANGKKSH